MMYTYQWWNFVEFQFEYRHYSMKGQVIKKSISSGKCHDFQSILRKPVDNHT